MYNADRLKAVNGFIFKAIALFSSLFEKKHQLYIIVFEDILIIMKTGQPIGKRKNFRTRKTYIFVMLSPLLSQIEYAGENKAF